MVKPRGLKEILEENKSLTRLITYEEFNRVKTGFDDRCIEEAYESYKRVLENQKKHHSNNPREDRGHK